MAYYNESNPKAAAWLRELIKEGLIPSGEVDERSICDVRPHELIQFDQQHFFAGIGGWAYALRLANWSDARPVRTGSCPCQPFSIAGKRRGTKDERHLWPVFRDLIAFGESATTFGEQVASPAGREWLSRVRADLENLGYEFGAADLCAAGLSAPHLRQRLYWVGQPNYSGRKSRCSASSPTGHWSPAFSASGDLVGMGYANHCHAQWWSGPLQVGWNCIQGEITRGGRRYSAQWRIKPGLSLLAYGIPGRVAQIGGFGNAIVPQVAAEFIQAYLETLT